MLRRSVLLTLIVTFGACQASGAGPATQPVTTTPQGQYAIARLMLSAGLQDIDDKRPPAQQLLMLAMRDGKLARLWFVRPIDGDRRLMVERSTLTFDGQALSGSVELRTAMNRGGAQVGMTLSLELRIDGEKVAGVYELNTTADRAPYKNVKGEANGTLASAPAPADAIAPQASWPSFWGPNGDMSAGTQPRLVTDLAKARPVWRSETFVPTGYGNAPDNRYFTRALVSGNGGGGSSPVVAGGTVYVHFFTPSPQSEPQKEGPFWERTFKDDAEFRAKMAALNATEREVGLLLNHFRPLADDHIVAIDAATGAERWRTVLPLRSPNHQTHKHRGISGVPLVAGGMVYVANLSSRLYALDAKTGAVKWEVPAFAAPDEKPALNPPLIPSPMMAGGHLIFSRGSWHNGTVYGLDSATGVERWQAPGSYVMKWSKDGRERLITLTGLEERTLRCIDPADGRVLWSQQVALLAQDPLSAVIAGDMLVAAPPPAKGGPNVRRYEGWKLSATGAARVWQGAELLADENMPVTISRGLVYLLGRKAIRVLALDTGLPAAERTYTEDGPGSNAWLGVVGDCLLLLPEGQHGTARLQFLDRSLKDLGATWLPTNVDTTAYNSQPIVYPIVDGRLFVRGGDGVYCYDIRE